jgi:DegV family protein with EDD domain
VKRVRIVTDSTADVPEVLASELDIAIVPCLVYIGQEAYRNGLDLSPQEYYDRAASRPVLPRTSQPATGDFVSTYRRMLDQEQSEGIISIHVAANFSGTVNGAWAAAQELSDPSQVEVVDSGTVSMGMGWVVIEAARMAQAGATKEEVSQATRALLPRSKTAAMIDNLENLYKGGRISQVSAALGTALQIKPLLSLHGGQVSVWGKVRTRSRALKRLVERVREWGPLAEMAVLHAGAEELAQSLADELADLIPAERVVFQAAGLALTTHLGLGAVGVCALQADHGQQRW